MKSQLMLTALVLIPFATILFIFMKKQMTDEEEYRKNIREHYVAVDARTKMQTIKNGIVSMAITNKPFHVTVSEVGSAVPSFFYISNKGEARFDLILNTNISSWMSSNNDTVVAFYPVKITVSNRIGFPAILNSGKFLLTPNVPFSNGISYRP